MQSRDKTDSGLARAAGQRAFLWLAVAGIGLLAAALQLYATADGIAASPDSRVYVEAARRLVATGSLTTTSGGIPTPLAHFPPLLSIILAGAGFVSADPLDAARWLNSLLLFANVVLSGALIDELSSHSWLLTVGGALMVAGVNSIFSVYVWAWSEPLFIFLLLLAFVLLAHAARVHQARLLGLAGLLVGMAWLTRYVGGAFAAGIAFWLVLQPGPVRARVGRVAPFLVASTLPIGLWSLRNVWLIGQPTDRAIAFHPITTANLAQFLGTGFFSLFIGLGLAAFAALILGCDLRRAWRRISLRSVIACLWLCWLIYFPSLLLAISFVDAGIPLQDRILSPALVLLIISAFSAMAYLSAPVKLARPVRWSVFVLYGAYLLAGLFVTIGFADQVHRDGAGFTSHAWKDSPTIALIRAMPADKPIYSNGEEGIYLLTGRSTRALPRTTDANLEQEAGALRRDVVQGDGVVVIFLGLQFRNFLGRDEIAQSLPPLSALQLSDAVVLSVKHPP